MISFKCLNRLLFIALSVFTLNIWASINVLQYNSATNQTTAYTIPLNRIDRLVTSGKFAWAIDFTEHQQNTSVSFFNGTTWEPAVSFHGKFDTQAEFDANNDGNTVSALFFTDDGKGNSSTHVFGPNGSGKHSWDQLPLDWTKLIHGRLWKLKYTTPLTGTKLLYVNQDLNNLNTSPITDKDSKKIISTITTGSLTPTYARYDTNTNTDYFYISSQSNKTSEYVTCQVPHNSTQVAKDIRCTMQTIDISRYIHTVSPDPTNWLWTSWRDNARPISFFSQDNHKGKSIFSLLWQQDDGQSWAANTYYGDFGDDALYSSPSIVNNVICPYQKQTMDQKLQLPLYSFPPSYVCVNLSHPNTMTQYTVKASDLNKDQDEHLSMNTTLTNTGVLLTETWVNNHHIYYVPFDKKLAQQELPNIPGNQTDLPHFAVFAKQGNSPTKILACGFSTDKDKQPTNLKGQLSKFVNNRWQPWVTSSTSSALNKFDTCNVSTNNTSDHMGQNQFYNKPATVWLYPDIDSVP